MAKKKIAYDETATVWHLMVTTRGGKVSMLQNLDAPSARQAYRSLRPREYPVKYINTEGLNGWSEGQYVSLSDNDIRSVKIIGPEGAELDPWRGVKPHIRDMAPERDRQRVRAEKAAKERQEANERSQGLNVLRELTPEIKDRPYRCSCCSTMMPANSLLYYVPDGVKKGDDPEAVRELVKASMFNGHGSGWCKNCVPKEPRAKAETPPAKKPFRWLPFYGRDTTPESSQ